MPNVVKNSNSANESLKDNPYQTELPKFLLIADGKYRDYYNSLPTEQKTLIESQARLRNLSTSEAVNKFMKTRIIESSINKGFTIPKFNGKTVDLNENNQQSNYNSQLTQIMNKLR